MLPNFLVQVPRVRVCQRLTIFGDHIKNEYGLKNEDDLNNEDKPRCEISVAGSCQRVKKIIARLILIQTL